MSNTDAWNHAVTRMGQHGLRPDAPETEALLRIMVRVSFADGEVQREEVEVLARLLPGRTPEALTSWVKATAAMPWDVQHVASMLKTEDSRWMALRFAARMAWGDTFLDPDERLVLEELAAAFALPDGAVARALREVGGIPPAHATAEAMRTILDSVPWKAAQFADGAVASPDLVRALPKDVTLVRRGGVDRSEVLGIYVEGLVGRFAEGAAFLKWDDIVGLSHGTGLGAGLRIHDADGNVWSLLDRRLAGFSSFLERLYRREQSGGEAPVVVRRDVSPLEDIDLSDIMVD